MRFWLDVWVGDCSLKILFPRLFSICSDQLTSVSEVAARGWCPRFWRNLGAEEVTDWLQLQACLGRQTLSDQRDRVIWQFDPKGSYSVRTLYRFIVDPGCKDQWMINIWNTKLPLKIQIFLWMLCHDRL